MKRKNILKKFIITITSLGIVFSSAILLKDLNNLPETILLNEKNKIESFTSKSENPLNVTNTDPIFNNDKKKFETEINVSVEKPIEEFELKLLVKNDEGEFEEKNDITFININKDTKYIGKYSAHIEYSEPKKFTYKIKLEYKGENPSSSIFSDEKIIELKEPVIEFIDGSETKEISNGKKTYNYQFKFKATPEDGYSLNEKNFDLEIIEKRINTEKIITTVQKDKEDDCTYIVTVENLTIGDFKYNLYLKDFYDLEEKNVLSNEFNITLTNPLLKDGSFIFEPGIKKLYSEFKFEQNDASYLKAILKYKKKQTDSKEEWQEKNFIFNKDDAKLTIDNLEDSSSYDYKIEYSYMVPNKYGTLTSNSGTLREGEFKTTIKPTIDYSDKPTFNNNTYSNTFWVKDEDGLVNSVKLFKNNEEIEGAIKKVDETNQYDLKIENLEYDTEYKGYEIEVEYKDANKFSKTNFNIKFTTPEDLNDEFKFSEENQSDYETYKFKVNFANDREDIIFDNFKLNVFNEKYEVIDDLKLIISENKTTNNIEYIFKISGLKNSSKYENLYIGYDFKYNKKPEDIEDGDLIVSNSEKQTSYFKIPKFETKSDSNNLDENWFDESFSASELVDDGEKLSAHIEIDVPLEKMESKNETENNNYKTKLTFESVSWSYGILEEEKYESSNSYNTNIDEEELFKYDGEINTGEEILTNSKDPLDLNKSDLVVEKARPNTTYEFKLNYKTSASSEIQTETWTHFVKPENYVNPDEASFSYEFISSDKFYLNYDISNEIKYYENANVPEELILNIKSDSTKKIEKVKYKLDGSKSKLNLADNFKFEQGVNYSFSFDSWGYGGEEVLNDVETKISGIDNSTTIPLFPENRGHWALITILLLIIISGASMFSYYQFVYLRTGSWSLTKKNNLDNESTNSNEVTTRSIAMKFGLNPDSLTRSENLIINEIFDLERALKTEKMLAVSEKANQSTTARKSEQLHELKGQNDILKKLINSIDMFNLTINAGNQHLSTNANALESQVLKQWLSSFDGITSMMAKEVGLTIIKPSQGEDFNIDLHKVNKQESFSGLQDGKILRTEKVGYKTNTTVLKPAEVIIVKN